MSTFPTILTPQRFDQLSRRSRHAFHWRASELSLVPLTNQSVVFARDSTAPGVGSDGAATVAPHNEPAWAIVDGLACLRLNHGGEREDYRCGFRLRPALGQIGYVELIDRGTAGDAVLHIGGGSTDDPSLTIRQTGGGAWEAAIRTAGGLDVSTAGSSASGDRVRLYWVLTPDGQMQLSRAVGDGDFAAGSEVTDLTLPTAWEEPEIRMGYLTLGGSGRIDLRAVKIAAWAPPPGGA